MTKDVIITLSINEAGTPPQSTYLFHVMVDGEVVASNQSLSPDESKAVREVSRRYNALFEGSCIPKLAAEKLAALGAELFGLWLAGSWEKIEPKVKSGSLRLLVIASDLPDVLNLPWELVHPPKGDFLGLDSKFSIRRFPRSGLGPDRGRLRRKLIFRAPTCDGQRTIYPQNEIESMKKITHPDTSDRHDLRQRRKKIRRSLKMHRRSKDEEGEAKDWFLLGTIEVKRERYEEARGNYQKSLKIFRHIGDEMGQINAKAALGAIDVEQGNYDRARETFREVLEGYEKMGSHKDVAGILCGLALIDVHQEKYDSARDTFQRELEIHQKIGDKPGEISTLRNLASIDIHIGDPDTAYGNFQRALKLMQEVGDRFGEAETLQKLAEIDIEQGRFESALEMLQKALDFWQEVGDEVEEANTLDQMGLIWLNREEMQSAQEAFQRELEIWQSIDDNYGEAAAWHNLALIDFSQKEFEAALEKQQKALDMERLIGDEKGVATTWHNMASIDLDRGEYRAGADKLRKSLAINQRLGEKASEAMNLTQLGLVAAKIGRAEEGLRLAALGVSILESARNPAASQIRPAVDALTSKLGYTQEQFEAMLQEVREAYQQDGGRGLIDAAFGED
jgi:tetratricopeptide (TPR) repeat protein